MTTSTDRLHTAMPARQYAEEVAAQALAHLFLGLMKADGEITAAEEAKMLYISQTYKDELPCNFTAILSQIDELRADPALLPWTPVQHLTRGMLRWDRFLQHIGHRRNYVSSILELLDLVMQEDGIDDAEAAYLKQVEQEMTKRFLSMKD